MLINISAIIIITGDKFITGSYDRTCKVWNTVSGDELLTLEGHRNVVYAIAFDNPYGDKIITGSFGTYMSQYAYCIYIECIYYIPTPITFTHPLNFSF